MHPLTHLQFRKQLVVELIGSFTERVRGGRVKPPPPSSLMASEHQPCPGEWVNAKGKPKPQVACEVCGNLTSRKCKACDVPLCLCPKDADEIAGYRACYEVYHKRLENNEIPKLTAPWVAREGALTGQVRTLMGRVGALEDENAELRGALLQAQRELLQRAQPAHEGVVGGGREDQAIDLVVVGQIPAAPMSPGPPASDLTLSPVTNPRRSPVPGRAVAHRSTPPAAPPSRRRRVGLWRGPPGVACADSAENTSFLDILSAAATDGA